MPQQIPVDLPEFEGQDVRVQLAGFTSPATILVDGKNLPYGPKKGTFALVTPGGEELAVRLRGGFIDPVPKIEVDGKVARIAPPLPWYVWLWSALPLGLIYEGGPIGGILGGLATACNIYIFRSTLKTPAKFLITGAAAYAAIALAALGHDYMFSHGYPNISVSVPKQASSPAKKPTAVYYKEQ